MEVQMVMVQAGKQRDKQVCRCASGQAERQAGRQANMQASKQVCTYVGRRTDRKGRQSHALFMTLVRDQARLDQTRAD